MSEAEKHRETSGRRGGWVLLGAYKFEACQRQHSGAGGDDYAGLCSHFLLNLEGRFQAELDLPRILG